MIFLNFFLHKELIVAITKKRYAFLIIFEYERQI